MHKAILKVFEQLEEREMENILLCVDGNYFKPLFIYDRQLNKTKYFPYKCIKDGDNKNINIAAASILAKTSRDQYIEELCEEYPELKEKYNIHKNKGYGAKIHLEGIEKYGISKFHRRSFGICKKFVD